MAHEKDETNPWHEGAGDMVGDCVRANGADEKCAGASPEIEETDEIEAGDEDDESILVMGLGVRNAFKEAGERVGKKEGEDEFHCHVVRKRGNW